MTIRYMGTKRHMLDAVHHAVSSAARNRPGAVVDLFAGTGTVAQTYAGARQVVLNDALASMSNLSTVRFTGARTPSAGRPLDRVSRAYAKRLQALRRQYSAELREEAKALDGGRERLGAFIESYAHVANSSKAAERAAAAAQSRSDDRYQLATLYFGAGYFSVSQAQEIDALRFAIDEAPMRYRQFLLAALTVTCSRTVNAPGHTAQFLRPNSDEAMRRITTQWARPVWQTFEQVYRELSLVGGRRWRARNTVWHSDALEAADFPEIGHAAVVYADPPYTKDQYGRYYHLLETIHKYDFPGAQGRGRTPKHTFSSAFCRASQVEGAFDMLASRVARAGTPLVVSYPSNGLLATREVQTRELLRSHFKDVKVTVVDAEHSTMGASHGSAKKSSKEHLYVCTQ